MHEIFGLGIEVYFAIIVIGIPVYFICRWLLKKVIKNNIPRIFTTWVLTVLMAPIFYIFFILLWVSIIEYYPKRDFDKTAWLANKEERYEYSDNIINSKMLVGKTKNEVRNLLGDEKNNDNDDEWYYYLGYRPALTGIDPDSLQLLFKNGKVVEVIQNKR